MRFPLLALLALAPALAAAPPSEVARELVGAKSAPWLIELKVENVPKGTAVIWDVFPEDRATTRIVKGEQALLIAGPPGAYRVKVRLIKGEDVTELRDAVTLTGAAPVPPPGPAPPAPKPVDPPPIPGAGLRVLVVYESGDLSKYPPGQQGAIYARSVRDYLNATCPAGPDGTTREWRMWDKDVDASGESKLWRDVLARPRTRTPWVCISNGTTGFEGPLPASADEFLTLLKKYGGK